MKIDSIKNYPTGIMLKHKPKYGLESKEKSTSTDLCENERVYENFNGSFTGKNVAAVLVEYPHKDGGFVDSILKLCDKHTVIAQNLVALLLAAFLRPLAIMSLPGKDKDTGDKIYASAHSIASGVIGFIFSSIVMYPLGVAADKVKNTVKELQEGVKTVEKAVAEGIKNPHKELENVVAKAKKYFDEDDLLKLKDSKKFQRIAKTLGLEKGPRILGMAPDVFLFGVVKAILTIKLIKPILKYGFGIEKSNKQSEPSNQTNGNDKVLLSQKPDITKFAGGLE